MISVSFQLCHLQPGIADASMATGAVCDEGVGVVCAVITKVTYWAWNLQLGMCP